MCPNLLGDAKLYELLLRIDRDTAAAARARGCACGGALHGASYERKPRGSTVPLPTGYDRRESFCCSEDGCRKRCTPMSVRFLGRKVYLGAVVVVMTALRHGRVAELARLTGASRETIARWRGWWAETFPATAFWRQARAQFASPVLVGELPKSLLDRFVEGAGGAGGQLAEMLDFIKPVTSQTAGKWESKTMAV